MTIARVYVRVDAAWRVTVTDAAGAELVPARPLKRVTTAAEGDFPLPATPVAAGEPHHVVCSDATGAEAAALYRRVVDRDLQPGDVTRYGRWLFDTLLGEAALASIAAATPGDATLTELALRWDGGDHALSRLHWEAMCSNEGYLAARRAPAIAVTRIVHNAKAAPRAMASPPRVLFAFGGNAGDEDLRPGAQLLGVLRPLHSGQRSLGGHVLTRATPRRFRDALARVNPDIVHVIAHGVVDHGGCLIELAADDADLDGRRSVDQLLLDLHQPYGLPTAVVLSVCDAGAALPLTETGSFAASLVKGGVPIVVGMAGRVADTACRLFARRFGEALLAGESIVAATAEGRRAAFADGAPPDGSIDWALPTLFLSEQVPPEFRSAPTLQDDPIEQRIAAFKLTETPVFCGRHEVVEELHATLRRPATPVLVLWSQTADAGRTRALKELAIESIRSGHVPVLVRRESPSATPFTTVDALARGLAGAIARTRKVFGLPQRARPTLQSLVNKPLETLLADTELLKELSDHLELAQAKDPQAFSIAIADDLAALATEARAAHPALGPSSRVIVLVDDVHEWDQALEPFLDVWIGGHGLGTAAEPVPVVLTFSLAGLSAVPLRPIAEGTRAGWGRTQIDRFREGEDLLAYETVLLHPFGDVLPKFSNQRWAFDFHVKSSSEYIEAFRESIGGAPNLLGVEKFYVAARFAKAGGFVVPARDEDVLRGLRGLK